MRNVKNTELERFKQYRVASYYSEYALECLYKIFCTYRDRGGMLKFSEFAYIPINKNPGDMTNEHGEWTKFVRNKMAHEWDSMIGLVPYEKCK